jgi:hypothetical protein
MSATQALFVSEDLHGRHVMGTQAYEEALRSETATTSRRVSFASDRPGWRDECSRIRSRSSMTPISTFSISVGSPCTLAAPGD